ncbi:ankyrin repeat-containing domain protein [Dactylonectria estremocensis]|uniref:Ankyrin repeat-containing domain protein n=1 Tax=Dactylonectria estremocensis TaxID=1079267 RepID=A0A9P9FEP5_9HYPO|nr:ankyrin repeat-containing domain protein [Dactylonectria estremocensis]
MDGFSVTSLTTLCSTISTRAISSASEASSLAGALEGGDQRVLQLALVSSALEQLRRHTAQLEEALDAATAISERLRAVLGRSLAACEGAVGALHKQLMNLQPGDGGRLDSSFLVAHGGFLMAYGQLFAYLVDMLSLDERDQQDLGLDSPAGKEMIEQAETATRLAANSRELLSDNETAGSSIQLPFGEQDAHVNIINELPPYSISTTVAPTSPSAPQVGSPSGRSKGFSLTQSFKALASGLRSKPDPFVSALCHAVTLGDDRQVAGLISQGANVNGRNETGNTPLKCSILSDQAGAARLLLVAGAKPTNMSWSDPPPLFQAASVGSLQVARVLLESGASVHSKAISGQPHFAEVVAKGNVPAARFLLENGADANTRAITGQVVVAQAAKDENVELVGLLLQHGANANATDIVGNPILATAVESGNTDMIELLLCKGGNVNARTYIGTTILEHAIAKKRVDIAKQLLAGGANAGATDVHSQPILINIIRNPLLNDDEKIEMMRLLLSKGADPDAADRIYGLPAICHAVEMPSAAVVDELLRHGARTTVRMLAGQTLLTYAIDLNRRDQVNVLLDHGVEINEVDGLNRTPLMLALLRLDYNLAKILVDYGANATAKANQGAVDLVKALGRNDLLELLGLVGGASTRRESNVPRVSEPAAERIQSPPPGYEAAVGKV